MSAPPSTRDQIFALVRKNPGIHRSELCQRLGLPWGTVHYHIRVLKAAGAIDERRAKWKSKLWPRGFPTEKVDLAASMRNPQVRAVYVTVRGGRTGIQELSDRLDLSRKVVRRILDELMAVGVLEREPGLQGKFRLAPNAALGPDPEATLPDVESFARSSLAGADQAGLEPTLARSPRFPPIQGSS